MLSWLRSLFAAVHSEVHTCASNYCECYYCYCHYPEHYHNLLSFFLFLVQRYNFLCAHTNILGEKFQKALFS